MTQNVSGNYDRSGIVIKNMKIYHRVTVDTRVRWGFFQIQSQILEFSKMDSGTQHNLPLNSFQYLAV